MLMEETCAVPVADMHALLFTTSPSPVFNIYHERMGNEDISVSEWEVRTH
jgi:hypothetical protein